MGRRPLPEMLKTIGNTRLQLNLAICMGCFEWLLGKDE